MALDLPSGSHCFVDANILYYAFTEHPDLSTECREFLRRVEAGDIVAHTTVTVLADAIHKTMLTEVAARSGRERAGLIGWLKKHPEILGHLTDVGEVSRRLLALDVRVLPTEPTLLADAITISARHLLLTNDALIVAVMRRHGLVHLITNDDDFDSVDGLTAWKPR